MEGHGGALKALVETKLATYTATSRMMIFAMPCSWLGTFIHLLLTVDPPIGRFTGDTSSRSKDTLLKSFKAGTTRIVVGTTGFGVGIDVKGVEDVIVYGLTYDLLTFAQPAAVVAGTPSTRPPSPPSPPNPTSDLGRRMPTLPCDSIMSALRDTTHCRRSVLETYLDGKPAPCCLATNAALCDVCLRHAPALPDGDMNDDGIPSS